MRVVYDRTGQTCNRLWSLMPTLIANLPKSQKVLVLFPDKEFLYFPSLKSKGGIRYSFLFIILKKLLSFQNACYLNKMILGKLQILRLFNWLEKKHPKTFINGWNTIIGYNKSLSYEEKNQLIDIYCPSNIVVNRNKDFFKSLRQNFDIVIGIHVRRGDYKEWLNGKYYYEVSEYMDFIRKLNDNCPDKVCFYISATNRAELSGSYDNVFFNINDSVVDDLYGLSLCDYIAGPPSSFSRFASFLGQVPLYTIKNITDTPDLKDFQVNNNYLNS